MIGKADGDEASQHGSEERGDGDIQPGIVHQGKAHGVPKEGNDRDISEGSLRGISHSSKPECCNSREEPLFEDK